MVLLLHTEATFFFLCLAACSSPPLILISVSVALFQRLQALCVCVCVNCCQCDHVWLDIDVVIKTQGNLLYNSLAVNQQASIPRTGTGLRFHAALLFMSSSARLAERSEADKKQNKTKRQKKRGSCSDARQHGGVNRDVRPETFQIVTAEYW